jgi:hypothetical protein
MSHLETPNRAATSVEAQNAVADDRTDGHAVKRIGKGFP